MCAPVPENKWSWKYDECQRCGTKKKERKYIHKGNGLCLGCFDRNRRLVNPKRQSACKQRSIDFHYKHKGEEKYRLQNLKSQAKYQKTQNYQIILKSRYRIDTAKRFLTGRKLKRWQGGIEIYCECCDKKVQTHISPNKLNDNILKLKAFQRAVKKIHEQEL